MCFYCGKSLYRADDPNVWPPHPEGVPPLPSISHLPPELYVTRSRSGDTWLAIGIGLAGACSIIGLPFALILGLFFSYRYPGFRSVAAFGCASVALILLGAFAICMGAGTVGKWLHA